MCIRDFVERKHFGYLGWKGARLVPASTPSTPFRGRLWQCSHRRRGVFLFQSGEISGRFSAIGRF
jgi:hypothetical protein